MNRTTELLFNKADWFSVQENQKRSMSEDIASYDGDRLLNTSIEDLVNYFEGKYRIEMPALLENEIVAEQSEAQIDVSRDPMRWIDDRSRPVYIPGARVTITIPFTGDSEAFYIRPSTSNYNPPRADIHGQRLILYIIIGPRNWTTREVKIW